jgi:hypothetical protein
MDLEEIMLKPLTIIKKTESSDLTTVHDIQVENAKHYILENGTVSHNSGFIYASSVVVAMKKLKLKEDVDGKKEITGIRAKCKIMKTRFTKPFEEVEIKIPWDKGMDPNSGLMDMFEDMRLITKDGHRFKYVDKEGKEHKYFRADFESNENNILHLIMQEYTDRAANSAPRQQIPEEVLVEEHEENVVGGD